MAVVKLENVSKSWGDFKEDNLPLSKLGELNKNAVVIFDEVAWDKGPDVQ